MNNTETEHQTVIVENIAPSGLGFGEGGISVEKQMQEGILTPEVPRVAHEVLVNDERAFRAVETDDDGCGDGRPWVKILRIEDHSDFKEVVEYKKSLLRPKVFGGGLVVASSMWRTVNGAPTGGETVVGDRSFMINQLAEKDFNHGAHTDNHAEGDKCGCGAIDNYPVITANAIKYRQAITGTLEAVYGDEYDANQAAIEETFGVYQQLTDSSDYFNGSTGKQTMEQLIEAGATIKELYGHHVEETIVINEAEGTTLDQQYFTQTVKDMCNDKPQIVQAFAVDVWRGRQIAQAVVDIKKQQDPSIDAEYTYKVAMADFMIRTLAVAGTLTAGDLPVYRRRQA